MDYIELFADVNTSHIIKDDEYMLKQVEAGLTDFESGRVTPQEEVMRTGREIVEKPRLKQVVLATQIGLTCDPDLKNS